MNALGRAREDGALFGGGIAYGDYRVERLTSKFGNGFRAMRGNVDANFMHDFNGQGVDANGFCARAMDVRGAVAEMAQEAFGHLAANAITGAEDEDALGHVVRGRL